MKNIIIIVLIVIIAAIVGIAVITREKVGDLRPSLVPPSKTIKEVFQSELLQSPKFPLKLPEGFKIGLFAEVSGARAIVFSPGGTLLVSQTGQGKVSAVWSAEGKTQQKEILSERNKPHGIAFHNGKLFIAEQDKVVRYNWDEQSKTAKQEKVLFPLPTGARHFTRSLVFNKKGDMFVTLGSTCDTCFETDEWIAAVIVSDAEGKTPRLYAKGLRNSVFLALNKNTDEVWATEMGRDFLGDETPPDEINILKDGHDYGWPVCYGNKVYDKAFGQMTPAYCENTEPPVFEIPSHSAPLGLTFIHSEQFPQEWQGDLLVAYHGSWNRSVPTGYKIVRLDVEGNKVVGSEDFLTGFLQGSTALGRPVDMTFDTMGNLYVSDDKAGAIYQISKQ